MQFKNPHVYLYVRRFLCSTQWLVRNSPDQQVEEVVVTGSSSVAVRACPSILSHQLDAVDLEQQGTLNLRRLCKI